MQQKQQQILQTAADAVKPGGRLIYATCSILKSENEDQVEKHELIEELQIQMLKAAEDLEFEKAAQLRDKIAKLKGEKVAAPQIKKKRFKKR